MSPDAGPPGRHLLLDFPSAGHAPKRERPRRAVGKSAAWAIGPCVSRAARQRSALLQRLRVRRFHHPSTADTVPDCGAMSADGKSRRRLWPQAAAGGHERQQALHRSTTSLPSAASGISAPRDPSLGRRTFLVRCPGPGKAVLLWGGLASGSVGDPAARHVHTVRRLRAGPRRPGRPASLPGKDCAAAQSLQTGMRRITSVPPAGSGTGRTS